VAVYPVDARGLFGNPAFSASQSGSNLLRGRQFNPAALTNANTKFFERTSTEHSTMDLIAEATGGQAFYNTNGLKEAVEKVVNYGDNYYTISYTPPNQKWNGAYRKIAVKVDRPGLHLSYRKGYFADDPYAAPTGGKVLPQNAMMTAMQRGGPDATQIQFDVMVVPGDAPVNKVTEGAEPNPKLMKPPYTSYTLEYLVDIRRMSFAVDDQGVHHGTLEVAALVYDGDGAAVNSAGSRLKIDLPADRFTQVAAHGLRLKQTIEAPAKGAYFLRIGIHDVTGDRVGAVEIPTASLKSKQQLRNEIARHTQAAPAK
jgi:hypothetical protein